MYSAGQSSLLRTTDPPLAEAHGKTVRELRRIGKRLVFGLEGDLFLVVHLMVTGRFRWRSDSKRPGKIDDVQALSGGLGTNRSDGEESSDRSTSLQRDRKYLFQRNSPSSPVAAYSARTQPEQG